TAGGRPSRAGASPGPPPAAPATPAGDRAATGAATAPGASRHPGGSPRNCRVRLPFAVATARPAGAVMSELGADPAQPAVPPPASFADLLLFVDVVEHLAPAELDAALRESLRILRPGGRVHIHTFPTRTMYDVTYRLLRTVGRRHRWPADPRNEYERQMHV